MKPDVIDTTENCRHCLMCRHMCPVGHVTHLESLTPHGWGQLVASEKRGLISWNDATVDIMFSCADCGLCKSHCVTDQPLPDALAAVRADLVARGLAGAVSNGLKERFEKWSNLYADAAPSSAGSAGSVALFVGDAAAHRSPETLSAALKLLNAVGIEPALIGAGRNSGFLATSFGFTDLAKRLAGQTLDDLAATGAKTLLVLSPADHYTFTSVYAKRIGAAWPGDVVVKDVVSVLDTALSEGTLKLNKADVGLPFAYVDPTHAVRMPERFEAPRRLLNAVLPMAPIELFWRKDRAFPGGDGLLEFVRPDIAEKLALARLEDARDRGAQGVVTEDPATLYQLKKHDAFGLPATGLYELLAERLNND